MTFPIQTPERAELEAKAMDIMRRLSPDELRVHIFMGLRMVDIGHTKYGPLDLSTDQRSWLDEQAQEASDLCFYQQCATIAKAQRKRERVHAFAHADDGAHLAITSVPVHADGGVCHGVRLVNGRCPGCGISPDTQSVEMWRADWARSGL